MSGLRAFAFTLIIVGILGLAYGGFTYTRKTHSTNIGPVEIAVQEKETVNVPIWAGIGAIVLGSGLLFVKPKKG